MATVLPACPCMPANLHTSHVCLACAVPRLRIDGALSLFGREAVTIPNPFFFVCLSLAAWCPQRIPQLLSHIIHFSGARPVAVHRGRQPRNGTIRVGEEAMLASPFPRPATLCPAGSATVAVTSYWLKMGNAASGVQFEGDAQSWHAHWEQNKLKVVGELHKGNATRRKRTRTWDVGVGRRP